MPAKAELSPARGGKQPPRRHIAGLDGFRAIAALLVIIYHVLPGVATGGFLGVDVFFVISGWLITALLLDEYTYGGRLNLLGFWTRRMRRLMPALAVVVLAVVPAAMLAGPDAYVGLRRQLLGVFTYSYNWLDIADGASYFDRDTPRLFTNVWSLAVEEQFYLVWPLLVLALLAGARWLRYAVPAGLAVAGITACALVVGLSGDLSRAHLGSDTHTFGMMLGALAAFATPGLTRDGVRTASPAAAFLRTVLAWASLVGLVVFAILLDGEQTWVYPWGLLVACLLTLGVLQAMAPEIVDQGGWTLTRLLDWAPIRWMGLRSYGLYLWHWPVWVMMQIAFPQAPVLLSAVIVLVLTFAGAGLSYRYVEAPVRTLGLVRWLRQLSGALPLTGQVAAVSAVSFCVAVTGVATSKSSDYSSGQQMVLAAEKMDSDAAKLAKAAPAPKAKTPEPKAKAPEPVKPPPRVVEPFTPQQVTVIGDSVTLASKPALLEVMPGAVVDAKVSRAFPAALERIAAHKKAGTLRRYVVVALASNGVVKAADIDAVEAAIGPERKLVLVTGFGPKRTHWIPPANREIAAAAASDPGRVRVADWAAAIAGKRKLLAGDSVHPGKEGAKIYAQLVLAALKSYTG